MLTGLGVAALAGCARAASGDETPTLGALDGALGPIEARHPGGRLGFVISGAGGDFGYRAAERFTYCSTFKLFLAAAVLAKVGRGEERLDRAVPVTAADMIDHAPVTQPAVGETLTLAQLCEATVEVSDNPAANILIRELGGLDALRAWYRSIGDAVTRVDRLEPDLNLSAPGDDRDTTTPAQAIANLRRLFISGAIGQHRDLLTRWLVASPTGPGRIKAGAPAGWTVGHKTGTGGQGQTNDIGIVWTPEGGPVFVAAYYAAPASTTPEQRDAVIADATRAAFAALGA